MQETVLSPLAAWQTFYVIVGTAAATLTGLMFVVITMIASVRMRVSLPGNGVGIFNTPNVVHLCTALLIAALLCAPWQTIWHVSMLLGIMGFGGMAYVVFIIWQIRHQTTYQPVLEDWLWHTILPFVSYTALLVAALLLTGNPTLALFVIAAATLLFLFIGIHNAWDNIIYAATELSRPRNQDQG